MQAISRPGTTSGAGRALDGTARAAGPPSRVSSGVPAVEADDSSGEPTLMLYCAQAGHCSTVQLLCPSAEVACQSITGN